MDTKWEKMYEAAKAVQNGREVSERIYAGGVAAAVESASGRIYVVSENVLGNVDANKSMAPCQPMAPCAIMK